MPEILNEKLISMKKLTESIFKMRLESEYLSKTAKPGQFVNIKCSAGGSALLRRPISICDVDKDGMTVDIVFQVKGIGTSHLSKAQVNSEIDLIGPLGTPFNLDSQHSKIAVVGGGVGIFPLLFLLKESKSEIKDAYLGFRNSEVIVLEDEFRKASSDIFISTEDGSSGFEGFITEPLIKGIEEKRYEIIYACGPLQMLKKVSEIAQKYGVKCQVSVEQRMGCGIGACLVCVCKTKTAESYEYSHVCKDGPVFWAEQLVFEE